MPGHVTTIRCSLLKVCNIAGPGAMAGRPLALRAELCARISARPRTRRRQGQGRACRAPWGVGLARPSGKRCSRQGTADPEQGGFTAPRDTRASSTCVFAWVT